MSASADPYVTLGVSPGASDAELRGAYRKLVQRHHPDHNGGSVESARRFEEIQLAYSRVRDLRAGGRPASVRSARGTTSRTGPQSARPSRPPPGGASNIDERMAAIEFELREAQRKRERELREERERGAQRAREREAQQARDREAQQARERAAEQAREAARAANPASSGDRRRASDEELGYFSTDDSLGKILSDASAELSDRFSHAREHPIVKRVSDLIDGLDDLVSHTDRRKPSGD
jgi:curved DNA-binding protein CbpA